MRPTWRHTTVSATKLNTYCTPKFRYVLFYMGYRHLNVTFIMHMLAVFSIYVHFNGYEPSTDATPETAPGYRPSRLHGGHTMAEGPGDRPEVHPRLCRPRVARTRRPRRVPPAATRGAQGSPEASWAIPLLSLQWLMKYAVHLGGESALDMAGYTHYLRLGGRARVHFYGEVPSWLKRLPMQAEIVVRRRYAYSATTPSVSTMPILTPRETGPTVEVWRWPLRASSPERAILEALDELPQECDLRQPRQGLRGVGVAPTQAAHGTPGGVPQREGAKAVLRVCRQAPARMAQAPGHLGHRLRVRSAGPQ